MSQWEEVIAINRKMGIESRVRDIVFQGIAQGQTIFWLRVNKGMILLRNKQQQVVLNFVRQKKRRLHFLNGAIPQSFDG